MKIYDPNKHSYEYPKRNGQKVILFDSPDGTGKTNIAQALSFDMKLPYFRMDSQHDNWRKGKFKEALEFDQTYLSEFLWQTQYSVIIDRAYPSEWVYSRAFGRETNAEVLRMVDEKFAKMGTHIIMPLRHDYSKNRKDEVIPNEMLPKIHDVYQEFAEWTKCTVIQIYVDGFDDQLIKELPAVKNEFHFDEQQQFKFSVTLDRSSRKIDRINGVKVEK